ncbi:MAG TPA: hypothetical protein VM532_03250 [Burkholderiales bacterium]|jgi:hypothetical protein|nr:hypothetical protein [Burkholderiales bacterium]
MKAMHSDTHQLGLRESHREDWKLAASKMTGAQRRAFHAEMTIKYCDGSARQAETLFGWNRHTVELGLNEKRTGLICEDAHEFYAGNIQWEDRYPEVADALWQLAQDHSQSIEQRILRRTSSEGLVLSACIP